MLLLPFSNLLNVKAEAVTITTDDTKLLTSDNNFKYVTNTTNLYLNDVAAQDTFSAYKVLDVYYNKSSNEITYAFTESFQGFIEQLDSSDEFANCTVEKYQQLTSDGDNETDYGVNTASTLNKLVSKYATYIKKQQNDNAIVVSLNNGNASSQRKAENIETGSYLILPNKVIETSILLDEEMPLFYYTALNTYGVMIANATPYAENGFWNLTDTEIDAKSDQNGAISTINNTNIDNLIDAINNELNNDIKYNATKDLFHTIIAFESVTLPTNTNESIKNNSTIMGKLRNYEITYPEGLDYDLDEIYIIDRLREYLKGTIKDNKLYVTIDGKETFVADVDYATNVDGSKRLTFSNVIEAELSFSLKLKLNQKAKTGMSSQLPDNIGNKITVNVPYIKDAYADITGMDQAPAEATVLGTGTATNTVYTYGLSVTNKSGNDTLNGAKFQIYSDKDCATKVGEEFEITENGIYTFKGLNDTDTYYLKQTKASTGYRLLSEVVELNPTSLNKETGLYNIEITNTKMGLLPSTGGLGTILYTLVGLLVIGIGSTIFIKYRQKQVKS